MTLLVSLSLALLAACDTKTAMDPGLRFELTQAEAHIDEAQRVSATGGDPTYECTAVRQMIAGLADESVHTVNATVTRGRKVCLEVTLKFAHGLIAKLEAAEPGNGREKLAAECVDLGKSLALAIALSKPNARESDAATPLPPPLNPPLDPEEKKRKVLCP